MSNTIIRFYRHVHPVKVTEINIEDSVVPGLTIQTSYFLLTVFSIRNSLEPNSQPNTTVLNTNAAKPAMSVAIKMAINPIDKESTIPTNGKTTNTIIAENSAAIIIKPMVKAIFTTGLVISLPFIITRVDMVFSLVFFQ